MAQINADVNQRMRLRVLADDLRDALLSDQIPSERVVAEVKQVVQVHSMYIQLLSMSIALDRLGAIPEYLAVMDNLRDNLRGDVASLSPDAAVRALHTMNTTIQNTYQIIREMTTTPDASSVLLSSFLKMVTTNEVDPDSFKEKLKSMSPAEKRKLVDAATQLIANVQTAKQDGVEL